MYPSWQWRVLLSLGHYKLYSINSHNIGGTHQTFKTSGKIELNRFNSVVKSFMTTEVTQTRLNFLHVHVRENERLELL